MTASDLVDGCPLCDYPYVWRVVEIRPSPEPQLVHITFKAFERNGRHFHTIHTSDPKLGGIIQLIAQTGTS